MILYFHSIEIYKIAQNTVLLHKYSSCGQSQIVSATSFASVSFFLKHKHCFMVAFLAWKYLFFYRILREKFPQIQSTEKPKRIQLVCLLLPALDRVNILSLPVCRSVKNKLMKQDSFLWDDKLMTIYNIIFLCLYLILCWMKSWVFSFPPTLTYSQ